MYEVKMKIIPSYDDKVLAAVKRDASATNLSTWHRRLGHLGDSILHKLVGTSIVKGMVVTNNHLSGICKDCILGKMDERPFGGRLERDSQLFGTLHADLVGPMSPEAQWTQARYSLIINDDCSGFSFSFNLKHKDEAAKAIIDLDRAIETKFQKKLHTLRTDNGGEFVNGPLQSHCRERGISLITSVAYNPELNGRAERRNRTHIEGARMMLKDSELGKDLWGEAILTHVYLCNRCPSSILPGGITPYERVFGHAPSIVHLCVLGTRCSIKVPDKHRTKLDDKARECHLISFEGESIYMVVNTDKRKLQSHDIIFMEGNGKQSNRSKPSFPGLSDGTMAHIEDVTDNIKSEVEAKNVVSSDTSNAGKRHTQSEV